MRVISLLTAYLYMHGDTVMSTVEKCHIGVDVPAHLHARMCEYQLQTGFSKSDILRIALLKLFCDSDAVPNVGNVALAVEESRR